MDREPRRRRRPALSCIECRRRKIKCDRSGPCVNCVSTQTQCAYSIQSNKPGIQQGGSSGSVSSPSAYVLSPVAQAQRTRTNRPTIEHGDLPTGPRATTSAAPAIRQNDTPNAFGHNQGIPNRSEDAEPNLQDVLKRVQMLEKSSVSSPIHGLAETGRNILTRQSGLQVSQIILNKTRIFTWSHWMGMAQEFAPIISCYAEAGGNALIVRIGDLLQKCKDLARIIKVGRPSKCLSCAGFGLAPPSREVADSMSVTIDLRLQILLVIGIGSSLSKYGDADASFRDMVRRWVYAAQAWLSGPLRKDRLDITGLQIHCLTVLAAMQIGLHRDPKHLPAMSVLQAELRRRLWATILEMILQSSLDSAMPPRISSDEFDTEAPSNINDEMMDDSTTTLLPHPKGTYTATSIQLILLESLPTRLRILHLLNGLHSELSYLDVLALSSEIIDAYRACSSFMKGNEKFGVTPFHRNMLHYLVRRFLIPLHCPFASKARTNPLFSYSLTTSLDVAMAIISPEPDEGFSHLMAVDGGLFREGIRLAATIINLELIAQVEAQRLDGTLHHNSQYREILKQAVKDMISLSLSHMFLTMILAQAEAIEAGTSHEFQIAQGAINSLELCYGLLQIRADAAIDTGLTSTSLGTRMKVLINGGGIAGNALAFWLSKLGQDVTVVERFPSLRATELQVDLRGHGIEVMRRMGLEQAYRSKLAPEQGLQIVDKSGRRRAYFPANKSGKGPQNFTTEFEIMRGDLCRLIYDATKDRTKYVFGTSIESFKEKESSIEVRFTDGSTDSFDLLVGADGQGSRTGKMMLGSDTADGFYPLDGVCVAYFTIPRPIQEGEGYLATQYMAPGRRGVYLGGTTDSERLRNARRGDAKEEEEALTEIFQGAGWQTEEIIKSMKEANDFYCERLGLVKLESWYHGRVALVGDAAYCPSANTGMGTTSAIVGAYILAGEIGKYCGTHSKEDGLATALKAYERKFQPFMKQVQKGVLEDTGPDMIPSTAFGIAIMHCLLGVASFLQVNLGKWMLKENVKGWDLPEYEEMRD
ncbi:FAD/NAD(P)-binding domain-containing protein [Mytilinidion resinicola]|uniref:FAD/NAD(P)-binding domain-containing protein n=1 Tax=Mytilinidion resinicola TaxID=574789 RepID=A0A6A6YJQ7_9PEZI|nr:FAD/NAD(P)-binding domain-containing protein [Mytilinidion resinicola]KAF2808194.1 FAD/NAD(P)-binding domain-containing protein [Mytilinidion resinicola]